ncbi:MAG: hypothetical protein J5736_03390 [Bacilli bacterium]|nr:hypothetical protein [Bacilli bacterium]
MEQKKEETVLDASGFLERPYPSKGIWNYLINLVAILLLALGIYFLPAMAIAKSLPSYQQADALMKQKEEEHGLVLDASSASKDDYIAALRHFYFEDYPTEIAENYAKQGLYEGYSIVHIFNVVVYDLPAKPTSENYQNDYFYYEYSEGKWLVDQEAKQREDLGSLAQIGFKNVMQVRYEKLKDLLRTLDYDYYLADGKVVSTLSMTRLITMGSLCLIFELILPLVFKDGRSLGEMLTKTSHAKKRGFAYRWYMSLIRFLVNAPLLCVFFFFLTFYATILALIIPALVDILIMILSKDHQFFYERFSFAVLIDPIKSDVFESEEAYREFLKDQEKSFVDKGFDDLLSSIEPVGKKEK